MFLISLVLGHWSSSRVDQAISALAYMKFKLEKGKAAVPPYFKSADWSRSQIAGILGMRATENLACHG
jgi:hypothetical protein